jgi:acyl carrier protein
MRDIRVLCRWPEWQQFRRILLESGKVDQEKLCDVELTTEVDSLEVVELIISMEQTFGVEYVESRKS